MAPRSSQASEIPQIAWRRAGVSDHDFMRRWSLQHRAPEGSEKTLCGIRIPWHVVGSGDARRCGRCDRAAEKRGS